MTDAGRDQKPNNAGPLLQPPRTPQQEPDIHNFSTSSSHRLVTLTGTQALRDELRRVKGIITSLPSLDAALVPTGSTLASNGIKTGHVTEVYGPPGSGKTAFGLQLASNVLHSSSPKARVVWLNTGSPLVSTRVEAILTSYKLPTAASPPSSPPPAPSYDDLLERFDYREISSFPHFLTLVMHPTSLFPPQHTTVMIIDDLSNFVLSSLPVTTATPASDTATIAQAKRERARRIQTVESLSSSLSSLASSRHIAIVVLSKCSTTQKPGTQAVLKPALAGQAWDPGVYARIVLYRDLASWDRRKELTEDERKGHRLAEVVRLGHKDVKRSAIAYVIEEGGLRELYAPTLEARKGKAMIDAPDVEAPIPSETFPATMPLSSLPIEDDEDEQLTDNPQSEPENLGPGLEEEPELPPMPDTLLGKRKAIEIADSDEEEEVVASDDEPDLPKIFSSAREVHDEEAEEMLFDEHTRKLMQRSQK